MICLTAGQPQPQSLAHSAADCRYNQFRDGSAVEKGKTTTCHADGCSDLRTGIPRCRGLDFRKPDGDVAWRKPGPCRFCELLQFGDTPDIDPRRPDLPHCRDPL